jgi:hypothetical protein
MEAKDAARRAIEFTKELFGDEKITNLGLEEVDYDAERKAWLITVGFSRPWDYQQKAPAWEPSALLFPGSAYEPRPVREYKVIEVNDQSGVPRAVRNRPVPEPVPA